MAADRGAGAIAKNFLALDGFKLPSDHTAKPLLPSQPSPSWMAPRHHPLHGEFGDGPTRKRSSRSSASTGRHASTGSRWTDAYSGRARTYRLAQSCCHLTWPTNYQDFGRIITCLQEPGFLDGYTPPVSSELVLPTSLHLRSGRTDGRTCIHQLQLPHHPRLNKDKTSWRWILGGRIGLGRDSFYGCSKRAYAADARGAPNFTGWDANAGLLGIIGYSCHGFTARHSAGRDKHSGRITLADTSWAGALLQYARTYLVLLGLWQHRS